MIRAGGIRVNAWVSGGAVPAEQRGKKLSGLMAIWDWYVAVPNDDMPRSLFGSNMGSRLIESMGGNPGTQRSPSWQVLTQPTTLLPRLGCPQSIQSACFSTLTAKPRILHAAPLRLVLRRLVQVAIAAPITSLATTPASIYGEDHRRTPLLSVSY